MLMEGCTDRQMHNRHKVITVAHPEHSSGELKRPLGHMAKGGLKV